jgi:hypothetical protein
MRQGERAMHEELTVGQAITIIVLATVFGLGALVLAMYWI